MTIVLAEQGINVARNAVLNLSDSLFMFLVERIAGTLQPYPVISGIMDFPCNPILCIKASTRNAIRGK